MSAAYCGSAAHAPRARTPHSAKSDILRGLLVSLPQTLLTELNTVRVLSRAAQISPVLWHITYVMAAAEQPFAETPHR